MALQGLQQEAKLRGVFRRKKQEELPSDAHQTTKSEGKGRPTPRRKDAQARNRNPIVSADPRRDRKAARRQMREERAKMNQALVTGDERYLPAAHKGPVRRYVRDAIDARRMLGEYFFPITIVILIALFVFSNLAQAYATVIILILYMFVLMAFGHSIWVSFRIKKELEQKYGSVRGTHMYAIARSMQMRRMRLPKPQVNRGEYPS